MFVIFLSNFPHESTYVREKRDLECEFVFLLQSRSFYGET